MHMVHHLDSYEHVNVSWIVQDSRKIDLKDFVVEVKEVANKPNYLQEIQDLNPVEQQGVNAFLKSANDDSKAHVVQAVKNFRVLMSNDYECPPIGVRSRSDSFSLIDMHIDFCSGNKCLTS